MYLSYTCVYVYIDTYRRRVCGESTSSSKNIVVINVVDIIVVTFEVVIDKINDIDFVTGVFPE